MPVPPVFGCALENRISLKYGTTLFTVGTPGDTEGATFFLLGMLIQKAARLNWNESCIRVVTDWTCQPQTSRLR